MAPPRAALVSEKTIFNSYHITAFFDGQTNSPARRVKRHRNADRKKAK
jgi:hypothetical protein